MECWWTQPSSHNESVHVHSRARSVSGTQAMAAGWDFADVQNQLNGIVRNKAIYLNVATLLRPFSTLDSFSAASSTSSALSSQPAFSKRHTKLPVAQPMNIDMKTRPTYPFSPCHMKVT